jgi:spore coat protein U-like protein
MVANFLKDVFMKKLTMAIIAALALITAGPPSFACTITTTPVNFGTYFSNQSAPLYSNGSVTVNCPVDTPFTIELDAGLNGGSYPTRMMKSGSDYLEYSLCQNPGASIIWGDIAHNDHVSGTGTGADQIYTVYGKIPAYQNIPIGSYSDSVTATVTW